MASRIYLNPAAFLTGGRFAGINPADVVLMVADQHADPLPGGLNMVNYSDPAPTRFGWAVTCDGVNMLDAEYDAIIGDGAGYMDVKIYLARLVSQGLIIVDRAGAIQTPAQILA